MQINPVPRIYDAAGHCACSPKSLVCVVFFMFIALLQPASAAIVAEYVGSDNCKACHMKEYDNFMQFSKKAKSFEAVQRMKPGLTEDEIKSCYPCHTTGYGEPGGFISINETPSMKNAGCESCHGPGGIHARTKSPRDIRGRLKKEDCEVCHTEKIVTSFRYKPLVHGAVH